MPTLFFLSFVRQLKQFMLTQVEEESSQCQKETEKVDVPNLVSYLDWLLDTYI